jgi:hypothetical protein
VNIWLHDVGILPVMLAITIIGLVLSVLTWRAKGVRSGIRGIAWSLLPLAAWLTNSIGLLGRIGSAVVTFAGSFILSPRTWLGVVLVGISALGFLVSGGIPLTGGRKRVRKRNRQRRDAAAVSARKPAGPAAGMQPAVRAPEDDLSDVQDILKRHGIS